MTSGGLIAAACLASCSKTGQEKPNVIIIMADDLGCGDLSVLGSTMLETPNIDRLCRSGLNMTDGHAAAPTSTPSRFSLMTGLYPWRNREAEILPGDAKMLIRPDQPTIAKMMKDAGYATGAIGKWHLGLGNGNIDWNREIDPSPEDAGFDESFIIAATVDRVPTVYVDNGRVAGLDPDDPLYVSYETNFPGEPTLPENPELVTMKSSQGHSCSIMDGIGRIGYQKGGRSAYWNDCDMADVFLGKVKDFISGHSDEPFFLYYGLHQPHVPRTPHPRFAGMSGLGPRGDVILEADWCVGRLLDHLDSLGLAENTLIIFSSDNGPVLDDGYVDMAAENWGDVSPTLPYRGGKYSLFDGGTHVPFFVSWPGHIPSESVSGALVCQMDIFASLAELVGQKVPDGLDSQNTLDAFLGKDSVGRETLVLGSAGRFTLRSGRYHLIPPYDGPAVDPTGTETGNSDEWALYNLETDIFEQNNIIMEHPEKAASLKELYKDILFPALP